MPPTTDDNVAIVAICSHRLFFANVIGIIITSGGIGKKILSIMQTNDKKNFALLWAAKETVFLNKSLNIFV